MLFSTLHCVCMSSLRVFDFHCRVFVDMMWYKAFSIYLVLRRGINVLFQVC